MPDKKEYDVAIVGYGPAGITAGIYVARHQLDAVLIGEEPGGEVASSGEIENWPGDGKTDGIALADKFQQHLRAHKDQVEVVSGRKVTNIDKAGQFFLLKISGGENVKASTVIYAAGRHPRQLGVPGEKELKGKGVSYCATCDAPLFTGKKVAVIGGGNTGAEAVIMLQKIASKIYLLHIKDELPADAVLVNNFKDDKKVDIICRAKTTAVKGDKVVSGLTYEDTGTSEDMELEVDGIFVTIGTVPNTKPASKLVGLDKYGAVKADRYGRTDVEGFFAAGDVTDVRDAQIVVAAGHGCSAALSAAAYLSRRKR